MIEKRENDLYRKKNRIFCTKREDKCSNESKPRFLIIN